MALLLERACSWARPGGVVPINQAMIAAEVTPERRGLAMGSGAELGCHLYSSSFVAPVLLVAFATAYGWHDAFFLAGIQGSLRRC